MFESNFPVDRASCSYTVLWNQFKKLSQAFSEAERAAMFHDTAARVYRLPDVKRRGGPRLRDSPFAGGARPSIKRAARFLVE